MKKHVILLFLMFLTSPQSLFCQIGKRFVQEDVNGNLLQYTITSNNTVQVNGCEKYSDGIVIVPSVVEYINKKYRVNEILPDDRGWDALRMIEYKKHPQKGISFLSRITLPSSITGLPDRSFRQCIGLKHVVLPSSLKRIGDEAFQGCRALSNLKIPDAVESIGDYCFADCSLLTSIEVPSKVSEIGVGCFESCERLKSMNLLGEIRQFPPKLFSSCRTLQSVILPAKLEVIHDSCFVDCVSLEKLKGLHEDVLLMGEPFSKVGTTFSFFIYGTYLRSLDFTKANMIPRFRKWQEKQPQESENAYQKRMSSESQKQKLNQMWQDLIQQKNLPSNEELDLPQISYLIATTAPQKDETPIQQTVTTPSNQVVMQEESGSHVDTDIPQTDVVCDEVFAVIIANEKYLETSAANVDFAENDGMIFKKYCHQTLGLPEKNIHLRTNATLNQMRSEIHWISNVAKAYQGKASIIFYYSGHGIPDERSSSSFLLPTDGLPYDSRSAYSLSVLYDELSSLPVQNTTVLLDACFSGAQRDGQMLNQAKSAAIKAKPAMPKGNMVVISAAQGEQTAHVYKAEHHGLFTYFLLRKLQESKGNVSLGDLGAYLKEQVSRHSIVELGKTQTPDIMVSESINNNWSKTTLNNHEPK